MSGEQVSIQGSSNIHSVGKLYSRFMKIIVDRLMECNEMIASNLRKIITQNVLEIQNPF